MIGKQLMWAAKLARIAKMVTNLREEFLHQVSRKLVNLADRDVPPVERATYGFGRCPK